MKVLVAVDDDEFGESLVDFVSRAFTKEDTTVMLLHVIEPSCVTDTATAVCGHGITRKILEERLRNASSLLNQLRFDLREKVTPSFPVEVAVLIGTPHRVILDYAYEIKADVIVIGSHGHGDLSRLRISSVSMAVLTHAECAVTIVKLPHMAQAENGSTSTAHSSSRSLA